MLRALVIGLGLLSLMMAAYFASQGEHRPATWLSANGLLLTLGVLFERWRYTLGSRARRGRESIPTGEKFVDPETDAIIEVMFDPSTGERHYVAIGRAPPPMTDPSSAMQRPELPH